MIDASLLFLKACEDWDNGLLESAFQKFYDAALLDDADSQNNLAVFFEEGIGREKSLDDAVYWYKRSIDNGSTSAINNIADLYRKNGKYSEAVEWFQKSIELGDGDSMYELGRMYLDGEGVLPDKDLAKSLFNKAIHSNDVTDFSKEKAKEILATIESDQ